MQIYGSIELGDLLNDLFGFEIHNDPMWDGYLVHAKMMSENVA